MYSPRHSPPPFTCEVGRSGGPYGPYHVASVTDSAGVVVADVRELAADPADAEAVRNALLFAAAPALLDLAERVLRECDDTFYDPYDSSPEWLDIRADAMAAVALAEGRALPTEARR